jgi:hypothetical protein
MLEFPHAEREHNVSHTWSSKGSGRAMQPFAPDPGPNFASGFAEWS